MKASLIKITALGLMMVSYSSFAEKITISGSPVVLEQRGEVYFTPSHYTSSADYNFVTIGDKNRVCYLEKQPSLSTVDLMTVNVNVDGTVAAWNCYDTNPEYFTIATPPTTTVPAQ